jgi:hypothetical protein
VAYHAPATPIAPAPIVHPVMPVVSPIPLAVEPSVTPAQRRPTLTLPAGSITYRPLLITPSPPLVMAERQETVVLRVPFPHPERDDERERPRNQEPTKRTRRTSIETDARSTSARTASAGRTSSRQKGRDSSDERPARNEAPARTGEKRPEPPQSSRHPSSGGQQRSRSDRQRERGR